MSPGAHRLFNLPFSEVCKQYTPGPQQYDLAQLHRGRPSDMGQRSGCTSLGQVHCKHVCRFYAQEAVVVESE